MPSRKQPIGFCTDCNRVRYLAVVAGHYPVKFYLDTPTPYGTCTQCVREAEEAPSPETLLYFSYGMNLDPYFMPLDAEQVGAARLRNWRLDFRFYADVQPMDGATVWGALWRITPKHLRMLDAREGYDYPTGYDRTEVTVDQLGGDLYTAVVYYMREPLPPLDAPAPGYLETVLKGYHAFQLPVEARIELDVALARAPQRAPQRKPGSWLV